MTDRICFGRASRARSALLAFALVASVPVVAGGADYALEKLDGAIPEKDAPEAVRKVMAAEGLRVLGPDKKPFVDLWLREKVPTQDARPVLGIDYGNLKDGLLLGVVRYHSEGKDFRGNSIAPGIYTLRKLTQPEDGDHLGVSETRDFVVLCPAKSDKTPDPLTERQAVKLSTEVSGSKHPAILYLVKPFDEPKGLPRVYEDEDLGFWIVDVLLPEAPNEGAAARAAESSTEPEKPEAGDKSKRTVRVALVLVGKAVEF